MSNQPNSSTRGNDIAVELLALLALLALFALLFSDKNTPPPAPDNSQNSSISALCTIAASEISAERVRIGTNDIIDVSVRANNPTGQPLLYNWQAVTGQMEPGLRSPSSQSTYTSPDYGTDDTISVDITIPGCTSIRRSVQISVINPNSSTSQTPEIPYTSTVAVPNSPSINTSDTDTSISGPANQQGQSQPVLDSQPLPELQPIPESQPISDLQPLDVEIVPFDRQEIVKVLASTTSSVFSGELYISFSGKPSQPNKVSLKAPGYMIQTFSEVQLASLIFYQGRNYYSILMSDYNDSETAGGSSWVIFVVTKLNPATLDELPSSLLQEKKLFLKSTPVSFFDDELFISFDNFNQNTSKEIHIVARKDGFVRKDYYNLHLGDQVIYSSDRQYKLQITELNEGNSGWFDNPWITIAVTKLP